MKALLLTRAETADLDGHPPAERARELIHDHAGAAVDVRRVLAREQERLHGSRIPRNFVTRRAAEALELCATDAVRPWHALP